MTQEVHIHEVIFLAQEFDAVYTPEQFENLISERFGAEVMFNSCSGTPFALSGAIPFLMDRGKICLEGGKIAVHPQMKMCNSHLK